MAENECPTKGDMPRLTVDLDAALDRGIADADGGRVMEIEEAFRSLRLALLSSDRLPQENS